MILVPDKPGVIHVAPEHTQPLSKVTLDINKSKLGEDADFEIAFNKDPYQTFYEGMGIPDKFRKIPNLTIKLRNLETKEIYKTDPFVIRDITYIGKDIDDVYPESMKHIYEQLESMKELMKQMEQKIIELSEEGTVV